MKPPRSFPLIVIAFFAIIVLLPVLWVLVTPLLPSGGEADTLSGSPFDARHLSLARNSLVLGAGTSFLCLIIGIPLAFLVGRTDLWARDVFGIIYVVPVLIPPYIHAIVWSRLNPLIKNLLSLDIHGLWGAIFVLTLSYFPFITLMTLAGLKSIDRNLDEASLLVHGRWQTLRTITIPLALPHVLSGAVFVFLFSIVDFGVPEILRVKVYPIEIFIQFSAFYNERAASAMSLPLIAAATLLIFLMKWHMKDRAYIQMSGGTSTARSFRLGNWKIPSFCFCSLVIIVSVCLPLAVLLLGAGSPSNYLRVLNTSVNELAYSLLLALCSAATALLLAFSLCYLIERARIRMRTPLEFAALLPLAIPAISLGIGLTNLWNRPVLDIVYGSSLIIIFGYVARFLPLSVLAVASGFKQLNPGHEEAAHLCTPRWARVVRAVVIPMLRPSLMVAFFIVFILSFGELGTTLLVIPPGRETAPIKIYNWMHYGAEEMVAALCLIVIFVIFSSAALFLLLHQRIIKRVA